MNNSNKIPSQLQGPMLQSQLFGRALDMCKAISEELLMPPKGADEVVNTIFRRDSLAVVK